MIAHLIAVHGRIPHLQEPYITAVPATGALPPLAAPDLAVCWTLTRGLQLPAAQAGSALRPPQPSQPRTTVFTQCSSFPDVCPNVWEQIRTPPFADVAVALCNHPRAVIGCIRGGKSGTKRESTGAFTLSAATALRLWTDMMRLTGSPGKEGGGGPG